MHRSWANPEHRAKRLAGIAASADKKSTSLSAAMAGNSNGRGNKGKVQSEEQRSEHAERMTGRVHSEVTRAKMSVAQKAAWERKTPEEIAFYLERRQRDSFKPTSLELAVQEMLDAQGIAFVVHPWVRVIYAGVRRVLRPDLLLPAHNLIIEVQGCYWHGCADCYGQRARTDRIVEDEVRRTLMTEQGYRVLELWEHDITTTDFELRLDQV